MLNLSAAATLEKNKVSSTGAWLILLEFDIPGTGDIRLTSNNENVFWPESGGNLYTAFPFTVEDVREDSSGALPSFSIKVSNVTRALVPYLEETDGFKDASVRIMVVHSDHLDLTTAEIDEEFDVLGVGVDEMWATLTMGAPSPMRMRSPKDRYLKDHCRFKFKSARCGYSGTATLCDRTFKRCKALGNSARYGGFPGIDGGVYISD